MSDSGNLLFKDKEVVVSVNPKLYPIEAVYSAAYVFMDRAYIVLDGDPEKEILVKIKPKSEESLENLGNEFNNELLNYSDYLTRAKETKKLREMLLQRAIITNDPELAPQEKEECFECIDEDYIEDPEGIAVPWEEKYGKKDENKTEQ